MMINYTIAVCFFDFSKAFDTLNHKILIKKLENNFGFRDNAKLFLSNYLSNRYQYTKFPITDQVLELSLVGFLKGLLSGRYFFFYMLMIYLRLQTLKPLYLLTIHCYNYLTVISKGWKNGLIMN